MESERVDCPADGCGKSVAIRYAAQSDAAAGRTGPHNKPNGEKCRSGYFSWSLQYGWTLEFWRS